MNVAKEMLVEITLYAEMCLDLSNARAQKKLFLTQIHRLDVLLSSHAIKKKIAPEMPSVMNKRGACVQNQTLEMTADILVRTSTVDLIRNVCWLVEVENACVKKDTLNYQVRIT